MSEMLGENGNNLRPEDQLLLRIARTYLDEPQADRVRVLLRGEIDWAYLVEAAHRHRVTAFLYWHLERLSPHGIPTSTRDALRAAFHGTVAKNLYLTSRLLRICDRFGACEILGIPYKGPVLGVLAYGNVPLREFDDLDLLVPSKDIPRAYEVMAAEGFHPAFPLPASSSPQRIPGQYLFHADDGTIVELHTEQTLRYFPVPLDFGRLSQCLQPVSLDGRATLTLTVEDMLPLLCVHGCKHFWQRLVWICDIAELARGKLNWAQASEEATRLRCEPMLLLGACLASELLDAPVPAGVLARAQANSAVRALAAQVGSRLFEPRDTEPGLLERFVFRARMRGTLLEGVKYSLRLATAPTEEDWERAALPTPVWAALRPFFLLRKYGFGRLRQSAPEASKMMLPGGTADVGKESPHADSVR